MLSALVLIAGCAAWHPQAEGYYPGTVMSAGEKAIDTWIEQGADGRLRGRYVLHEPTRDVEGTLDAVGDDGCEVALFRWTDVYGTGVARLRFFSGAAVFRGGLGAGGDRAGAGMAGVRSGAGDELIAG